VALTVERGEDMVAAVIRHDLVRTSDLRRRGAVKWGRRRMGRSSVHLGQWGAHGEKRGGEEQCRRLYTRRLSVPCGEKKRGGLVGRVARGTCSRLARVEEGARLVRRQRCLASAAGDRQDARTARMREQGVRLVAHGP
jgi:hypothetical protein